MAQAPARFEPWDPQAGGGVRLAAVRSVFREMTRPRRARTFLRKLSWFVALYGNGPEWTERLGVRPLDELLPGSGDQRASLAHRLDDRALPYAEAYVLAQIVGHLRPRRLFEIGTYLGTSTRLMVENAPPDAHVFTLDLPPDDRTTRLPGLSLDPPADPGEIGRDFRGTAQASQITQLWGDSATFDYSPYRGSMDLVFVDGAHSYPYVRSDSAVAVRLLAPGGVIVWDDCSEYFPTVVQGLDELAREIPIAVVKGTRLALHVSPRQ